MTCQFCDGEGQHRYTDEEELECFDLCVCQMWNHYTEDDFLADQGDIEYQKLREED